ncbi:hypothetical protein BpHYR1_025851, partial [Brachionus plicatilis]
NISCVTEYILGLLDTFSCIDSSFESSSNSIPFGAEVEACVSFGKPSGYSEWNKVLLFSLTIIKKDQKLFKCVSNK